MGRARWASLGATWRHRPDIAPPSGATWAAWGATWRHRPDIGCDMGRPGGDMATSSRHRATPGAMLGRMASLTWGPIYIDIRSDVQTHPAWVRLGSVAPTSGDIGCDMGRLVGDMATSPRHRVTSGATWAACGATWRHRPDIGRHRVRCGPGRVGQAVGAETLPDGRWPARGGRHGDIDPTSGDIGCDTGRLRGDMPTSLQHRAKSAATWIT